MIVTASEAARSWWRPWWLALTLWLALAATASIALWQGRHDALDSQRRELGLLSLALTDELARGLRGAEEGLHALRAEMRQGRLPLAGAGADQALRTRADLMPLVQSLWLLDGHKHAVSASDATSAPDSATFEPGLDELADEAVAVGRPFTDVQARGPLVPLAVRVDGEPGRSTGWILAAIPATTLLGAFSAAVPAADARMAVLRSDGVRLAGADVAAPMADAGAVAGGLPGRPVIEVRTFGDGSAHLLARHEVPRYGITVVVSRDLRAVLDSWREAAELTAAAFVALLAVMAAAVHLVQRADARRAATQHALQVQLARASKLESLGALAGGVAHDFNNVLAGIVGYGEMAQDAALPGSDQARHLEKILRAALRGKALIERILAFSRGGGRVSVVFELEPVVEEVLALLASSLRPGIVLERQLAAHGARLRGDPTQAFEAVMNLCTNAMQAMPDGGMLSVHVERVHAAQPRVLSHSRLAAAEYVAVTVADQGPGITPEVMERLFEPFFTTRSAQSGTGLGLAVVHGVVAEFGGAIDVDSTPGRGARFTLYFPECSEALAAPGATRDAVRPGAGQRLLVVDDEPELVDVAVEMLAGLGYRPEGTSAPQVALKLLREDPHRFAAVITDEVMPEMSGTRLTQHLREFAPALPVLLVSGYGGAWLAQRAAAAGATRLLAKPLRRADLARALADALR